MTLWQKPLDGISFADIEAFCNLQIPEGAQLDYKQEMPSDLARTVSAFANTRGGLLLLGVEADKTTNTPVLPIAGMDGRPGISEQIMQICRDGIYPGFLPEMSPVIQHPTSLGKVFIVVRVDESGDAPHSINNSTNVYVRTRDTNQPFDLAHIDRIAAMLERRRNVEVARELLLSRQLARCRRGFATNDVFAWWFCAPEYPHDAIFSLEDCRIAVLGGATNRVADGYVGIGRLDFNRKPDEPKDRMFSAAGRHGDLFYAHSFRRSTNEILSAVYIARITLQHITHCRDVYEKHTAFRPGLLHYSMGLENVEGSEATGFRHTYSGGKFIDSGLRLDRTVNVHQLSTAGGRHELAMDLVQEVFHAFDLPEPDAPNYW